MFLDSFKQKVESGELMQEIQETGGSTQWFYEPQSIGYVASNGTEGILLKITDDFKFSQAHREVFYSLVEYYLLTGADAIGFWIDEVQLWNGDEDVLTLLYIDPSYHFEEQSEALEFAKKCGELSIYDLNTQNCISVK